MSRLRVAPKSVRCLLFCFTVERFMARVGISNMKNDKRAWPGCSLAKLPTAPNRPLRPFAPGPLPSCPVRSVPRENLIARFCLARPALTRFCLTIFLQSRYQHSSTAPGTFRHHPSRDRLISCVSNAQPGFLVLEEDDGEAILDAIPALLTIRATTTPPSQSMFAGSGSGSGSGSCSHSSRHRRPVCRP